MCERGGLHVLTKTILMTKKVIDWLRGSLPLRTPSECECSHTDWAWAGYPAVSRNRICTPGLYSRARPAH